MARDYDSTPTLPDLEPWPTDEEGRPLNLPCDNCGSPSCAILDTTRGCVAFPGKPRRMNQCSQHINNWGYLDGQEGDEIVLVSEVAPGIARWAGW